MESMVRVHLVFHVSTLRKCLKDPEQMMEVELVIIEQAMTMNVDHCKYWSSLSV